MKTYKNKFLYDFDLRKRDSHSIYKKGVEKFCEYMKISLGHGFLCPKKIFVESSDWGHSFSEDVLFSSAKILFLILEKLERDLGISVRCLEGCEEHSVYEKASFVSEGVSLEVWFYHWIHLPESEDLRKLLIEKSDP